MDGSSRRHTVHDALDDVDSRQQRVVVEGAHGKRRQGVGDLPLERDGEGHEEDARAPVLAAIWPWPVYLACYDSAKQGRRRVAEPHVRDDQSPFRPRPRNGLDAPHPLLDIGLAVAVAATATAAAAAAAVAAAAATTSAVLIVAVAAGAVVVAGIDEEGVRSRAVLAHVDQSGHKRRPGVVAAGCGHGPAVGCLAGRKAKSVAPPALSPAFAAGGVEKEKNKIK